MSADIGRHAFAPMPNGSGRCADCLQRESASIHATRPACTRTGSHGSHGACAGVDFPSDFRPATS